MPTNLTRNQMIIVGIIFVVVVAGVLVFMGVLPGLQSNTATQAPNVSLTAVGPLSSSAFNDMAQSYEQSHGNVKISYTQISEDNYESVLTDALASGNGPDIFMIKNSWLSKHANKIYPVPSAQYSLAQMQDTQTGFPTVVVQDFVSSGNIYALPLYIDTLAMFYNKDTLDAKSIATLPRTWTDFENLIPKIREINSQNQLSKPAAAIGGSSQSIDKSSDLLKLIFMQYGNPTISSDGEIRFGINAADPFNFYVQFANPASQYYTWSDSLDNSLTNFSSGKTAMIFNYASAISEIKSQNQNLSYGISFMPQIDKNNTVNQASYWGLTVSKQSKNPAWAWDFIATALTNPTIADAYAQAIKECPALRPLIAKYLNDPNWGVFASQALTARDWPQPDDNIVSQTFSYAINSTLTGKLTSSQSLEYIRNNIR